MADIWRHGFVSIKALDSNIDNIGAYLTAYLSDLDIESGVPLSHDLLQGEIREVQTEQAENKHVIKGARLKLLPVGLNIYRCSRGIKKPLVEKMSYGDALEEISSTGQLMSTPRPAASGRPGGWPGARPSTTGSTACRTR